MPAGNWHTFGLETKRKVAKLSMITFVYLLFTL
jgi:hypothetical protein